MHKEKKRNLGIRLSPEMYVALEAAAKQPGLNIQRAAEAAIRAWLEQRHPTPPDIVSIDVNVKKVKWVKTLLAIESADDKLWPIIKAGLETYEKEERAKRKQAG